MPIQPVSHTRPHPPERAPTPARPVLLVARDLAVGEVLKTHSHPWGQLTYAREGAIRVTAGNTTWIVPPLRAIWIPPRMAHEIATLEPARLRALYVHVQAAPGVVLFRADDCVVLEVSALLRELIAALADAGEVTAREAVLAAAIQSELAQANTLPMGVALPSDKRLLALCEKLIASPASTLTLRQWAGKVGASERTLARLFERELGMSFARWRQQARLAHAMPLIARGLPLSRVASELGYASQSAFSAMFRKTFGKPPSVFLAERPG